MPSYPTLSAGSASTQMTETFLGYDHNLKISDGEFYDMENLSSDHYPMMGNRPPRVYGVQQYEGLLAAAYVNGALVTIAPDGTVSCDGQRIMMTHSDTDSQKKTIVTMGAYVVIFPDGTYFNTSDWSDFGSINNIYTIEGGTVAFSACDSDGNDYEISWRGSSDPSKADDTSGLTGGQYWWEYNDHPYATDEDAATGGLKRWNALTESWVSVPLEYIKISAPGIAAYFSQYDGAQFSGADSLEPVRGEAETDEADRLRLKTFTDAASGSLILQCVDNDNDFVVIAGVPTWISASGTGGTFTVSRTAPTMDYVVGCQNRLWGCRCGSEYEYDDNGEILSVQPINEIYCCALGDFKNWEKYEGLSTDSYRASCGVPGIWTGAAVYNNYPLFFKEDWLYKVYVSSTGAHQIIDSPIKGVTKPGSLALVNDMLLYVSRNGPCIYDGSSVYEIGAGLNRTLREAGAVTGLSMGNKYYAISDGPEIFVYDTTRGLWYREDCPEGIQLAISSDRENRLTLFCGDQALMSPVYIVENPDYGFDSTLEHETVSWSAETGLMGYTDFKQKYVTRFSIRMVLPKGSRADFWMRYDEGDWEHMCTLEGKGTRSFLLPIKPRRCDHFRFKMTGTGDFRVYSIARYYEQGSDAVL